jgi:hypothetical protein
MLAADPTSVRSAQRYFCLDLLNATFEHPSSAPAKTSDAVLLEVWEAGGLLQTDCAADQGCGVCLSSSNGTVRGHVCSCLKDEYGYLVEFAVESADDWFPGSYRPAYLLPAPRR